MKEIPKFCALCDDEGDICFCGTGNTPDEAFDEFISNGDFEDHCADCGARPGDDVEVKIYSVVDVKDSDWPEDEVRPEWNWCLHRELEIRTAKAQFAHLLGSF